MNPQKLEALLGVVKAHPYHHYLALQGFESADGKGQLQLTVDDQHINPAKALHGGVVYSVLDVVSYIALLSLLPADKEAVTHDIHVSVLRPATKGDTVTFSAEIEKLGRSLAFINAKASVNGKTIATARVTKSIVQGNVE